MRYFYLIFLAFYQQALYAKAIEPKLIGQGDLTRVLLGLFLVLLFIAVLSWGLKRLNGLGFSGDSKGFKSIAGMSIGPKERVMLIQVGERFLLLGVASGSITTLADFGEQMPAGFDGQNKAAFSNILKSALGKSGK